MANKPLKTLKFPGLANTYTVPQKASELQNDSNVEGTTVKDALNAQSAEIVDLNKLGLVLKDGQIYQKVEV